ncbi:histidine kinase famiy protein [Sphingomonas sp. S1-29]|uniref:histidine kinase famiy protein n=1 Tax=Sphingomonas sp. S1-29 TaxID=2991074 RepID=UPI002240A035|nr:histidine kinase famiy protein [Sphingomonas sp. S1-29]UZK69702.1 histidine kinase famiy protein [Sphingomonas sp. S1-29]
MTHNFDNPRRNFDDGQGGHIPPAPPIRDGSSPSNAQHDIFFAAVETTRMPMVVTDPAEPDNPIIFCNAAFIRMTGYSREEIVGRNCRFLQGDETDPAAIDQIRQAIRNREEVALEILNYRKNGSTFWNALFVSPVYDDSGALKYFFASQLDISRRREAEEALHQAQKMEAVGQLTGGIAHDFNNLLQVVLGYVDLLEARVDPADRSARRAIDAIGMAANRGATLTQQLLAFARKQELRDRLLNLNSLITDFEPIIDKNVGDKVTIRRNLADDLWNARIDPVQAEMALLNLLSNARDAMGGSGVVTIATENVVSTDEAPLALALPAGEYVSLSVTDSGEGIDPPSLPKIFDPFFSTKGVGKGTGLGLSMVYGFMRQSGGGVAASNRDGGGARFALFFPRSKGMVERTREPVAHSRGEGQHVLMVEDQPQVAELGKAILEDLGYEVVHVDNAQQALEQLRESDGHFDLLFTDIVMPGMSGVALAQAVRREFPSLPILLTTGYSDRTLDAESRTFDLVRKPYRRAELSQRVHQLLEGPSGVT